MPDSCASQELVAGFSDDLVQAAIFHLAEDRANVSVSGEHLFIFLLRQLSASMGRLSERGVIEQT